MFLLMYPTRIIFGRGVIKELGKEISSLGKKALLVTGRSSIRKTGILDRVTEVIKQEGISLDLFDRVEHDPWGFWIELRRLLNKRELAWISLTELSTIPVWRQ